MSSRIASSTQKKTTKCTDIFWTNADIDQINAELFNADFVKINIIRCFSAPNYTSSLSKSSSLTSTNTLRHYKNNLELNISVINS